MTVAQNIWLGGDGLKSCVERGENDDPGTVILHPLR